MPAKRRIPARSVDAYLAAVGPDQRAALAKLRSAIRAAAPGAEEGISYQLPAFRHEGRMLVGFGATSAHCAFYLMSNATVAAHADLLAAYDTSKGTIRFPADRPLPAALVRKLVRARMAEITALQPTSGRPSPADLSARKRSPKPTPTASRESRPRRADATASGPESAAGAAAFMRQLRHPLKQDIETVRRLILGVSPDIREGVKWNSLSFRTKDYFATVNLRSTDRVQLIFHLGAKVKDNSTAGMSIADPAGLIKWLARDRCLVTLGAGQQLAANRAAFEAIVREWIGQTDRSAR